MKSYLNRYILIVFGLFFISSSGWGMIKESDNQLYSEKALYDSLQPLRDSLLADSEKSFTKNAILLSQDECEKLTTYYKELLKEYEQKYIEAYTPWKEVFCGCEERRLDMYVDGVSILLKMIDKDTTGVKNYESMRRHRDELMELYNLIVENITELNEQIDLTRSNKLTVAALRARQQGLYVDLLIADSLANGVLSDGISEQEMNDMYETGVLKHGETPTENTLKAKYKIDIFKDQVYKLYSWLHDVVYSNEKQINEVNFVDFSMACLYKIPYDLAKTKDTLSIQESYRLDGEQCKRRMDEMKTEILAQSHDANFSKMMQNHEKYYENMCMNFDRESYFIGHNDFARLEEFYRPKYDEIKSDGEVNEQEEKVINDIVNALEKDNTSELYFEVMKDYYFERNKSFALAYKMAIRAFNVKKYDVAAFYFDKCIGFEQFASLKDYEKSNLYTYIAYSTQLSSKNKYSIVYHNLKKAIEECPILPAPYLLLAEFFVSREWYSDKLIDQVKYCLAYDYCDKAIASFDAVNNNPDYSEAKLIYSTKENAIARKEAFRKAFPNNEQVFMKAQKDFQENHSFSINIRLGNDVRIKETTIVRCSKRTD